MEQLLAEVKNYVDLKLKYYKLSAVEKLSVVTGSAMSLMIFIVLMGVAVLLFFVALAVLVAGWVGSLVWGFVIMGGFCLLVALIFWAFRKNIFANSMVRMFSKIFFNHDEEDRDDE